MESKFVMVDGMDGSGKGVVIKECKKWAEDRKLKTIDLCEFWEANERNPKVDGFGAVVSAEPTYIGWGRKIREKLISLDGPASDAEIAEAFSKDRKKLYDEVVLPALRGRKHVFQDRGVVTSLVYQPLMKGNTRDSVMELPGNRLCLAHPPDLLIVVLVDPKVGVERATSRKEKKDNAIFETVEFQKEVRKVYEGEWLRAVFEDRGTEVVFLDTSPPMAVEDTKREARKILRDYL